MLKHMEEKHRGQHQLVKLVFPLIELLCCVECMIGFYILMDLLQNGSTLLFYFNIDDLIAQIFFCLMSLLRKKVLQCCLTSLLFMYKGAHKCQWQCYLKNKHSWMLNVILCNCGNVVYFWRRKERKYKLHIFICMHKIQ